ncbi:MAG TPA: hypothetical protein VK461_17090 [Acidimicrobiales bacterium]|nr:hypothetical protein [Acidimicrobiales bacterium]
MKRTIAALALGLGVGVFLFSACGDDSGSSIAQDTQQLCSDVSALKSTVEGIAGQDINLKTTSVSDVKDKISEIQSEIEAIGNSKSELSDQVKSELKDAYNQLKSDLSKVKDADTLQQAGQQLETARTNFRDAWEGIVSQLNCSPSTTG